MPRGSTIVAGIAVGILLGSLAVVQPLAPAAQPASQDYTPVSPAPALHAAAQASLKLVQDWLADKDFLSAVEAAQQLTAVVQLYSFQSARPAWRTKASVLREGCARLTAAARAKHADGCARAIAECQRGLAELAKEPPGEAKVVEHNFRPPGSNRVWMQLLDGAYTDARSAATVGELQTLAYQLAEEANVVGHLRGEARWRQLAGDVRTAALAVVQQTQAGDLSAARQALKKVYPCCEACHQGYKR